MPFFTPESKWNCCVGLSCGKALPLALFLGLSEDGISQHQVQEVYRVFLLKVQRTPVKN